MNRYLEILLGADRNFDRRSVEGAARNLRKRGVFNIIKCDGKVVDEIKLITIFCFECYCVVISFDIEHIM